ncbi:uncharacterized protein LOC118436675 [Folsomia candida]|uniref:F-box domain-containing protein n=1 Tax=Folsomia candida TaxID=158441 RepID=A0A226DVD8_FOLCA|nr:uncharacterized protein LOC118436675 [Folsomia candida]OXA49213.1 hypothetical protein Fcan01_15700 [Folsomia candida]
MDFESNDRPIIPPHLAVTLPEIVREIVSFIPNHDLCKNVTLVSRGWEDAARKLLVSRVRVNLTPQNMASYLELTKIRGNHNKRVFLSYFNFENLSPEESNLLENFTSTATAPITELRLDYFPYGAIHPFVVSLFSHCPKLEFVSFAPRPFKIPTIKSSHPKGVSFPKVEKFEIFMTPDYSDFDEFMNSLSLTDFLEIVSIFPNLKTLRCGTLPENIVEYFLSDKASTSEISVRLRNMGTPISIQNRSLFLTRVEFKVGLLNNSANYAVILAIFADQLEKLKLTAEYNLPRKVFDMNNAQVLLTITFPEVLPRLKCLAIGIPKNSRFGSPGRRMVPGLNLKFGGYSTQFPSLEKLVLSKVGECEIRYRSQDDELGEQEWFEVWAGFLSKYFLKGECLTVRDVRTPSPPGKRVGFRLFQKVGGARNTDNLVWEVGDYSDFYERISTTFPNLRWETFEGVNSEKGGRMGADRVRVGITGEEWVEV